MSNQLATIDDANMIETVLIGGDLSELTPEQRVSYYKNVCESLGLNPLTKPFDYIKLNNKLTLHPKKDATDQLRNLRGVSFDKPDIVIEDGLIIVTISGKNKQGRTDADVGVVTIGNLQGDKKANAIMKAVTKAKRRLTLSLCGLGWTDESEMETIPNAQSVQVDERGVIDIEPDQPIISKPNGKITRPLSATQARDLIQQKALAHFRNNRSLSEKQEKIFPMLWSQLFDNQDERYYVTEYLFGVTSSSDLTDVQKLALMDWMSLEKDDNGHLIPSDDAIKERSNLVSVALEEKGQQSLGL